MEISEISSKNELNPILQKQPSRTASISLTSERLGRSIPSLASINDILKYLFPSIQLPKEKKVKYEPLLLSLPEPVVQVEKVPEPDMESSQSVYIQKITPQNSADLVNEIMEEKYNSIKEINSLFAIQEEIYIIEKILNSIEQNGNTNEFMDKKYNELVNKYEEIQKKATNKQITPEQYLEIIKTELKFEESQVEELSQKKRLKNKEFYLSRVLKRIKVIKEEINQTQSFINFKKEKQEEIKNSPSYRAMKEKFDYLKGIYEQYNYVQTYCINNNIDESDYKEKKEKVNKLLNDFLKLTDKEKDNYDISLNNTKIPKKINYQKLNNFSVVGKRKKLNEIFSYLNKEKEKSPEKKNLIEKVISYITEIYNDKYIWTPLLDYKITKQELKQEIEGNSTNNTKNTITITIRDIVFPATKNKINKNCYINVSLLNCINEIINKKQNEENFNFSQEYNLSPMDYAKLPKSKLELALVFQSGFCCGGNELESFIDLSQFRTNTLIKTFATFNNITRKTNENGTQVLFEVQINQPFMKKEKSIRESLQINKIYDKFDYNKFPKVGNTEFKDDEIEDKDIRIINKEELDNLEHLNYLNFRSLLKMKIASKKEKKEEVENFEDKINLIQENLEESITYRVKYIQKIQEQIVYYKEMIEYCEENKIKNKVPILNKFIRVLEDEKEELK